MAEATALGIRDRVHLLGYRDDAHRWLGTMNVFTLPSLSEGLPLSLLEAMAAGIPTVVTEVGGMPEVVQDGHTGLIVPPGDPQALAKKLLFLLDNPTVAADLGAAGRNWVSERFSLDRMVTDYLVLYRKALSPESRERASTN
jgi:glycosyltransferase involved in cell wall biosynthesis